MVGVEKAVLGEENIWLPGVAIGTVSEERIWASMGVIEVALRTY